MTHQGGRKLHRRHDFFRFFSRNSEIVAYGGRYQTPPLDSEVALGKAQYAVAERCSDIVVTQHVAESGADVEVGAVVAVERAGGSALEYLFRTVAGEVGVEPEVELRTGEHSERTASAPGVAPAEIDRHTHAYGAERGFGDAYGGRLGLYGAGGLEMIVIDFDIWLEIPALSYRHVVEAADTDVGTDGSARQRYAGILHVKRVSQRRRGSDAPPWQSATPIKLLGIEIDGRGYARHGHAAYRCDYSPDHSYPGHNRVHCKKISAAAPGGLN